MDLGVGLGEGVGGEVRVEYFIGSHALSDEPFFHHFCVYVDDIVVEPLAEVKSSHSFVGQFLDAVKTGAFDLQVTFGFIFPVLSDDSVLIERDGGIF